MSKIGATRKKQEVDLKTNSLTTDVNVSLDSEQVDIKPKNVWVETDVQSNAAITITRAGEPGKSHYILGIIATFADSTSKSVGLYDGTTQIMKGSAQRNSINHDTKGIKITQGNKAEAQLAASGTAGIFGKISMIGFTE